MLISHDARQQAYHGIEQYKRGYLSAGKDVVADRYFLKIAALDQALVYSFEASAEDDCARPVGQFAHLGLCQRLSPPAHQQAGSQVACRSSSIDSARQHVWPHYHAGAAASRRVIHATVLVGGEIANLDRF